jgi:CheY-like chemotaxis protein
LLSLFTREPTVSTTLNKTVSRRMPVVVENPRQVSSIRRALLVEDNPVNQELALAMLMELGVATQSAWTGEEALVKVAAEQFDVILMDCQMPKLDGYATTRRLREWERRSGRERTPVVALTANTLNGAASRCFDAGMDRYLSKPFTIDQLFRVLESCVPGAEEPVKPLAEVAPLPPRNTAATSAVAAIPVLTSRVAVAPPPRPAAAAPPPPAPPPAPRPVPADAAPPALTPALLDEKTLDQIRELQRNVPDLLAKVAELYLENSALLLAELRAALQSQDGAGLAKAAHALKSTSFNTGAKDLAELCAALETVGLQARIAEAGALLERIVVEHARVALALNALQASAAA